MDPPDVWDGSWHYPLGSAMYIAQDNAVWHLNKLLLNVSDLSNNKAKLCLSMELLVPNMFKFYFEAKNSPPYLTENVK